MNDYIDSDEERIESLSFHDVVKRWIILLIGVNIVLYGIASIIGAFV